MSRRGFQLTTLQEDLKRIGLLEESTTPSEESVEESSEDTEANEEEELEEAAGPRRRRHIAQGGSVRWKKATPETAEKRKARVKAKRSRKRHRAEIKRARARWERSSSGKRYQRAYKKAVQKEDTSSDRLATLIDKVNASLSSLEETSHDPKDAIKAFANVAIISEALSKEFDVLAEATENLEIFGLHKFFLEMAHGAARTAKQLVAEEVTPEDVEGEFKAVMEDLLDGVELFDDVRELSEASVDDADVDYDDDDDDDCVDCEEEDAEGNDNF